MSTSQDNFVSDYDLIRNIIAQVAIAIDRHDWSSLEHVFTADAVFDFPAPIGAHNGLLSLQQALQDGLRGSVTQHSLGTQTIDRVGRTAKATTYVTTLLVEPGKDDRKTHTMFGTYEDELVKEELNGHGSWRITKRKASNSAHLINNATFLG
ncbi:SnoaL-like domain-containing protein [Macrophomina phaseolina]|uniref:SnoaL-like domain-containing protein n=1 Tax=Macrophomina phaseolina TaxID=35725 RepID=A0ABQ8FPI4_9PEZI|nr:SnoaL-like domain-containing protein [Macrophomina phaseolina]